MLKTRYFTVDDKETERLDDFEIPKTWWSRIYEYEWCKNFLKKKDVILDAGCGVSHPFKFFAVDRVKEVHAVDKDHLILDDTAVLEAIRKEDIDDKAAKYAEERLDKVNRANCGLIELDKIYPAKFFDVIFCISVLEHDVSSIPKILEQFSKVLKNNGTIVLTLDYPMMNIERFRKIISESDFVFAGEVIPDMPKNAVRERLQRYRCFRSVLVKKKQNSSGDDEDNFDIKYDKKVVEPKATKPQKVSKKKTDSVF